jgi:hypothetical protein
MMRATFVFVAVMAFATSSVSAGELGALEASILLELKDLNKTSTTVDKHPVLKNATKGKHNFSFIETSTTDDQVEDDAPDAGGDVSTNSLAPPSSGMAPVKYSAPADADASKSLQALTAAMSSASSSSSPESRATTTATMEAAIMSLMKGGSAFGATPMGGSVKKIVNILTNDMMPKVKDAHKADQNELNRLMAQLKKCFTNRDKGLKMAAPFDKMYKHNGAHHKTCRAAEAVKFSSKTACLKQQSALYQVKQLKCQYYASISRNFGSTVNNVAIVTKAGSESVQSYIGRLSGTICGRHVHGEKGERARPGGWGGGLDHGMLDQ